MSKVYLLLFLSLSLTQPRRAQENLPSLQLDNSLENQIIEIFNHCQCVIFYRCDEDNFIIPPEELGRRQVAPTFPLEPVTRLKCTNQYYYCCQNRTSESIPSTTSPPVTVVPKQTSRPTRGKCGKGTPWARSTIEQYPWTVSIYEKKRYSEDCSFKCGGSLIHPKVVLTAQHCVRASTEASLRVVSNSDVSEFKNSSSARIISKIIRHRNFYSGGLHNDIALLILQDPLDYITPICLPSPNENFDNKRCVAVGWGSSDQRSRSRTLRAVNSLPIIDTQTCQNTLRRTELGANFNVHPSFMCAGGEDGRDTCRGDGGSPLMCMGENNRYVQAGIVSWGLECGQRDVPSLYTNVAKFTDWIGQQMRDNLVESRYG